MLQTLTPVFYVGSGVSTGAASRRSSSLAAAWHPLAAGPPPPQQQQPASNPAQQRPRTPQQPDPPSPRQPQQQQRAVGPLAKSGMTAEMEVRRPSLPQPGVRCRRRRMPMTFRQLVQRRTLQAHLLCFERRRYGATTNESHAGLYLDMF